MGFKLTICGGMTSTTGFDMGASCSSNVKKAFKLTPGLDGPVKQVNSFFFVDRWTLVHGVLSNTINGSCGNPGPAPSSPNKTPRIVTV